MEKHLTAIDLFAGCGGLSRGFIDAGFKILLGVDNDEMALKTFKHNHEGAQALRVDLSNFDEFSKIDHALDGQRVDVVIAGPPCQGFSLTGPRNFDDDRNKLYLSVIEAIQRYKPKAFVIENVPGMGTLYKGEIKQEVINRLQALGYNVVSDVLCTADYGVPQKRKRLFFVGVLKDLGVPRMPHATNAPENYVTCRQALSDLPPRIPCDAEPQWIGQEEDDYTAPPETSYQKKMRAKSTTLFNHVATKHKQFVIDTIKLVPEGGNHKDLPKGVGESRKFNEAWTRYHGDKPSKTIDTGHRNHFHYEYHRVPTIRENARLQSFPDDFVFFGSKTQQNRQVGNAVPPLMGYHLGQVLKEIMRQQGDT